MVTLELMDVMDGTENRVTREPLVMLDASESQAFLEPQELVVV